MNKKHFCAAVILLLFLAIGIQTTRAIDIPTDTSVGTWDGTTYTLNTDVSEGLVIVQDDLILDGAGHTVSGSPSGVHVFSKTGCTIQNLEITGCSDGIFLQDSTDITVNNNNIHSNNNNGIHICASAGYANDNILSNNIVSNNTGIGICLGGGNADNNEIYNNTVSNNGEQGIYLCSYANHNTIYNNNFINNTPNADVIGFDNVFDLGKPETGGKGGNYWCNWCPPDHPDDDPADGIVDELYLMPPHYNRGQDNYPWAQENGWSNHPPVANAGPDQTVECACQTPERTKVTLNGSGSYDPDGDPLTYTWTGDFLEGGGTISGETPTITLNGCQGPYEITLIVNDGKLDSGEDTVTITVVDTTPPAITCPGDITIDVQGPDGVPVGDEQIQTFLAGASAPDNCDSDPTITYVPLPLPDPFLAGDTTVTFTATDASGNWSSCSSTVTVVEAAEANLRIIPPVINRDGRLQRILAVLRLPEGTTEDDINMDEPLILFPGDSYGIEAISRRIVQRSRRGSTSVSIFAFFSKDEVTAAVPEDGPVDMMVIGRFVSGQYFYGIDTVRIISWSWRR